MSETRALNAALSSPVFHGAATRSALHASERHVERWAPEGPKATRAGGLRSLGFVDRIAAPWMTAAMQSRGARMMASPTAERSTPEVSWLFPRPWFQDELDWMAAARVRAEQAPQFLTTRGTYESARSAPSDVAMPMVAPAMVAPSMAGLSAALPPMAMPGQSSGAPAQVEHGLRAFSPMVPFAAAAAAQVVAGTIGMVQDSGLTALAGVAGRSPILGALTMVAPAAFAPARSALPSAAPAFAAPTAVAPPSTPAATRAMIDAARAAVTRVEEARQPAPAEATPVAGAPVGEAAAAPSPITAAAEPSAGPSIEPSVDRTIAHAAIASPAVSQALRTVDLLLQATAPSAPASVTAAPAVAGEAVATGGFQPSAGPRVAMPAGLGGLIMALDAQRTTTQPMARYAGSPSPVPPPFAPALRAMELVAPGAGAPVSGAPGVAAPAAREVPGFAPVWAAPATALGAIAGERARAVDHMAWSDRWLARFAGASPVALAAMDVAHERAPSQLGALRTYDVASPEQVYLRPPLPAATLSAALRASSTVQPLERPVAAAPPRPVVAPDRALRIDDGEAVPDDIFAAIAAAAVAPVARPPAPAAPGVAPISPAPVAPAAPEQRTLTPADVVRPGSRPTIADLVSIAPPPAPHAGLAPGLAASPLAPAMAAMLPLPASPIFDTRALYPEALSTAYLGGLLTRSAAPIGVVSSTPTASVLMAAGGAAAFAASFAAATDTRDTRGLGARELPPMTMLSLPALPALPAMSEARAWSIRDLAVAPAALRLAEAAPDRVVLAAEEARRHAPAGRHPGPAAAAPLDLGAAPGLEAVAPSAAEAPAARADAPTLDADLVTLRAALLAGTGATSLPLAFAEYLPMLSAAAAATAHAPTGAPARRDGAALAAAPGVAGPGVEPAVISLAARGLTLPAVGSPAPGLHDAGHEPGALAARGGANLAPALGELHAPVAATSTGRPGSLAELMLQWSVAEERAVTDLSFDFVAPEMVLAAKVYGLSPAVAAQAARLAVAGPSAIASLATSVDLTFLRGFQQAHAQQQAVQRQLAAGRPFADAEPTPSFDRAAVEPPPSLSATAAPGAAPAAFAAASPGPWPDAAGEPGAPLAPGQPGQPGQVLASRLPRGAFLWPEATVAALGLKALSPEGVAGMPVVALELLAAAAVADLGTWVTAFPSADQATIANVIRGLGGTVPAPAGAAAGAPAMPFAAALATAGAASSGLAGPSPAAAATPTGGADLAEAEGAGLAGGSPAGLRARFEAIYVARAQSGEGQLMSPSARAARAMALLARGDGGSTSARERALAAWSILPQVYDGGLDLVSPAAGPAAGRDELAESRPGLASLAARAGESLGSFVAPSGPELSGWREEIREEARAEALAQAQVFVKTTPTPSQAMGRPGRAFAQLGGGEAEIPAWFEAAARRMLDERSPGGGMSMAELVLVTAAATPAKAVAAATRGASSTAVSASPMVDSGNAGAAKPDVDKLALDVYQEVLKLIDIARERSGDPYK